MDVKGYRVNVKGCNADVKGHSVVYTAGVNMHAAMHTLLAIFHNLPAPLLHQRPDSISQVHSPASLPRVNLFDIQLYAWLADTLGREKIR